VASKLSAFFAELRRRKVTRVAVVYALVGIGVIEAAQLLFDAFELPHSAFQLVAFLVVLGFPIAVVLAWALEVTPTGIQRTPSLTPEQLASQTPEKWSPGGWLLAGVGLVVVLATGYFMFLRETGPDLVANRVIVLPYENLTGDPSLDPVGRMAADWITEGLAQTGEVEVIPNSIVLEALATARQEGREAEDEMVLQRIVDLTGSGIRVTGSYYLRGDQLELHSEVVDAASGTPLAVVEAVQGSPGDPGGAIDSVRIQVMGALATRLSPRIGWELPPTVRLPTYGAYQAYSRGMREWTNADYREAGEWFERAYAMDTTYLRSLMLAMSAYRNVGNHAKSDALLWALESRQQELAPYDRYRLDYYLASRRGDRDAGLAAVLAAVELVPLGTVRMALPGALLANNRPLEALTSAEELLPQFGEIASRWYVVWGNYTEILHLLGEHEQELAIARQGREQAVATFFLMEYEGRALAALGRVDELSRMAEEITFAPAPPGTNAGRVLLSLSLELRAHEHKAESLEILDRALEWYGEQSGEFTGTPAGREILGRLLYAREIWSEAAEVFESLAADSAARPDALGFSGVIAARQGKSEAALRLSEELAQFQPYERGSNTVWRARIAAVLGQKDEAVALLRRAFGEGIEHGLWLHSDMDLEALRGYEPFEQLIAPEG
jgi:tetratricopeptide (TPR) repeat protein